VRSFHLGLIGLLVAASGLAGCASDAGNGTADSTDEDLMVTSGSFSADVTVFSDHLELPRRGNESALTLRTGRLLVGQPGGGDKNPHGFLRRTRGTRVIGDTIFIDTERVQLTDIVKSAAVHADSDLPALTLATSDDVTPQGWTKAAGGSIGFPQQMLLSAIGMYVDPVRSNETFNVQMKLTDGNATFTPHVTTDLGISGGELEKLELAASGKLDANVTLDLSATPRGTLKTTKGGLMQPLKFETRIAQFPAIHTMEMVGFVPVWESVEPSIVLRCELALNGQVDAKLHVHAAVDGTFGAAYAKSTGWHSLLSGPNLDTSGTTLTIDQTGTADVKCSLEPQVAMMVYDFAGPTLAIGPYANVHLDETQRSWSVQPGVRADVGVMVEFAHYALIGERVSIFDAPIGKPLHGTY